MNHRLALLSAAALVLVCPHARLFGQPPSDDSRVPEILTENAEEFLEDVASGQVQTGYEQLVLGGPLEKHLAESSLVAKTEELPKKFGPARDYRLVQSRAVGENLVILKYLHEFEEFPIVWYITFYRRGAQPREENWVVVSVRFDTNFESLIDAPKP